MRLVRFGEPGAERPGVLDAAGKVRDASQLAPDWNAATLEEALARPLDAESLPPAPEGARLGACVARPGKIIAIGLNYEDHARETGAPIPAEPIVFMKATTSFCGPFDDVVIPRNSSKTDWEVELGVVIGKKARHVAKEEALAHVAGYCVINDVSEREHQVERGGQWVKGKSHDNFCPTGPQLVTPDEIGDVQDLGMWLELDGRMRQQGSTKTMIFGVAHVVAYLSEFMTLEPGDLITTGTPPGVGMGCKPPEYLRPGMRIRLGIDGLGEQAQDVVAAP